MKGLTHFVSGVCAASFIPQVVKMSASGEGGAASFILLLAGAYGVLPDTMDFKLGQFFSIAETELDPDPKNLDPQHMADEFARVINEVGDSGKPQRVQFFTSQVGANRWQQYNVIFEPKAIVIQFNEVVSTSQIPFPGTAPAPERRMGRAEFKYELKSRSLEHDWLNDCVRWMRRKLKGPDAPPGPVKPSTVDIFGGPQFGFRRESDGKIYFDWLPWHRTWSHSWVLGFLLTLPVYPITYFLGLDNWWLYGLVAFLGFFFHVFEDMTGHIGGALFWPLHKPRSEGLELFKASDPRTNFSIMYTAIILTLWNLDRFTTHVIAFPRWFANFPANLVYRFGFGQGWPQLPALVAEWLGHALTLTLFLVIPMVIYFKFIAWLKPRVVAKENERMQLTVENLKFRAGYAAAESAVALEAADGDDLEDVLD
ncbi:MAG TPA: metal-dependent hydrolase [bacterium]|nr:metal-dependent hydrolase [bacterium]